MSDTPQALEDGARLVCQTMKSQGFQAYWVGGCVRDRLLGRPLKDIDIATDARPQDIAHLFEKTKLVGAAFGVCIVRQGEHVYEVATFRQDGSYTDHRRPDSVTYGTAEQDAHRRDFTINALFQDPETGEVLDLVGGMDDLRAGRLRTVGDPRQRFSEDALRLLRAIRFAARLDFEIEAETWEALREMAPDIRHVSPERHRDELTRILMDDTPSRALRLMDESGLLERLLPEIAAMKGVEQGRRFHPEGDVFVHTLLCLDNLEVRTPVTVWAMLLHDVGKPPTAERDLETGKISFYGHERVGAEMAEDIGRRLRMSNDDIRKISDVVARHMRFMHASDWNRSTMRKFLAADTIEEDLAIHKSDCRSSHGMLHAYDLVRGELAALREKQENPIPPPLLTGQDLKAMGFQPGPIFREILEAVQERQLEGELRSAEEARGFVAGRFQGMKFTTEARRHGESVEGKDVT
ncbi:MAG: CCA tRNA nucleotidyltransferase [Sumerlaeia bacterium]